MRFRDERELASAPEAVWPILLDLGRAPSYLPYLECLEPLDGPPALGARVRIRMRRSGMLHDAVGTVTALEAERLLEIEAPVAAVGARATLRYELTPLPWGSLLGVQLDLGFDSFLAEFGARALHGLITQRQKQVVDGLVAEIERGTDGF